MHGEVEMRTLYIAPARKQPGTLSIVAASGLLRELILPLGQEPVAYETGGRAGLIGRLIETDGARVPRPDMQRGLWQAVQFHATLTGLQEAQQPAEKREAIHVE